MNPPSVDGSFKGDIRQRTRSMSLAPLPERHASSSSPGITNNDAVNHSVPMHKDRPLNGPAINHILSETGDNLLHIVEHMDTVINAHASVIAEGTRPPLEKRQSALDGLKNMFKSSSQPGLPGLEDLLTDVRPFSRIGLVENDQHMQHKMQNPLMVATDDLIAHHPATPPPNGSVSKPHDQLVASLSAKTSGKLRKVHPQEQGDGNSAVTANHEAPTQTSWDRITSSSSGHTSPQATVSSPTSRRQSVVRRSRSDESDSFLMKRRGSYGAHAGVQSHTRSASKGTIDKLQMKALDETRQAKVAELMEKDVMVLNENQLAKIQQRDAHPFTISVDSSFRRWWDFIIAACTAYVMVTTPVKVGFNYTARGLVYAVDVIVDLLFLAEIPFNMFTSYIDETTGEEVKPLKKIRQNYIYGYFVLDAMSSFPAAIAGRDSSPLSLAKIFKIVRMYKMSTTGLFKAVSTRINRSMNPSMMRMLELTVIFFISQHFIACTYYYISLNQHQLTSWQPPDEIKDRPLVNQYVHAVYFAIMVTTANDVNPTTTTEKLFTSLMLFVGIVINASIIGSAANLLSNLDKAETARKNQMDSINDYMRFKKVSLKLQEKIRRYYEYALNSRITDPTETIFAELPDRLKLSLRLNLHDEFIGKVPLFRVCSNAGVIAIIQCLKQVVAMPQEVIITQGEMASEFYFIKNGRVSLCVRLPMQEIPLGNLGEGSFFGESSLLTGDPQQAEVKSESITELAYLTKSDFLAIIDKFPTFYLAVRRISDNRMQTAHNVQRMTKMQRRQSHPHVPQLHRKVTMKKAAVAVMNATRLRPSFHSAATMLCEGRRVTSTHLVHPVGLQAASPDVSFVRLSQRFSSSRRNSSSGLFSANYLDRISLGQARHLSTLRCLDGLQIENSADDPLWN